MSTTIEAIEPTGQNTLDHGEPLPSSTEPVPAKARTSKPRLLTLLHLICIASFAIVLTWGLQGKTPINGDDVRVIRSVVLRPFHGQYDYLAWTRGRLHVLGVLNGNYQLAGKSMDSGNLIWLAIYVASAFAAYAYLRRIVSPAVALLGSIFFLSYSSKFEPLTWWSAGAYTLVWLTFFGLLRLLESKFSFRVKSAAVASIILVTMYVYEVFTVLAPVLSLLLLLRRRRETGRLKRQDWLFAALPTVVVLVHIATLSTAKLPIYYLDPTTVNKIPLHARVFAGFTSALDATVGPLHNATVKKASHTFDNEYQKDDPKLKVFLWIATGLTIAALLLSFRWTLTSTINPTTVGEHAVIGAAALLVSAAIGFVSNYCVTPSRLTGIPSIGLMICICAGIELILCLARRVSGRKKFTAVVAACVAIGVLLAYSVREMKAFSALLRQAGEVHDSDIRIATQIKALHPVSPPDDEIYVRMPRHTNEVLGRWTNFWSGFNTGRANETFWYLYDVDPGTTRFNCTPCKVPGEDMRMQQVVEQWSEHGINKVTPFYVDNKEKVFVIKTIQLTDVSGHVLKTIDFSKRFVNVPANLQTTQQIPIIKLPANL